ncbi:unnamed protein product [marine sediment metagenome]|uniref:VRR-NUC domain-containing protein n=1 Tax=marine sediment metagenome TaxID=412755 RepID=X0SI40_9ZZZZ
MKIEPILKNSYTATRKKRAAARLSKKAGVSEKTIQSWVNHLLNIMHIPYLRIPDRTFAFIMGSRSVPIWVKSEMAEALGGFSDNILFAPLDGKHCLCRFVEVKTETGKLRQSQKYRQNQLDVKYDIVRSPDELKPVMKEFEEMTKKIINLLPKEEN